MALQVGNKYKATVTDAGSSENKDGVFSVDLTFHTDDGDIDHQLKIQDDDFLKHRYANLKTLGATDEQIDDWAWLQKPTSLIGARCQIVISEWTDKEGRKRLQVKYINSVRPESKPETARSAATLLRTKGNPDGLPF